MNNTCYLTDPDDMLKACERGDLQKVRQLLEADSTLVNAKDINQKSALHIAAEKNFAELTELLITAGADINAVMQVMPPWGLKMLRKAIHRKGGSLGLFGNVLLSNVPGPKEALYLDHWKLVNWYSTGQIFDGTGLNITMWSYCGQANVCMLIDRAVLKDGWVLFNYFVDELDALVAVTRTKEAAR